MKQIISKRIYSLSFILIVAIVALGIVYAAYSTTIGTDISTAGFTTSGTSTLADILYVNKATGNVGIGTTEPGAVLEVSRQGGMELVALNLFNTQNWADQLTTLRIGNNITSHSAIKSKLYNGALETDLSFWTRDGFNVTQQMVITSNGNLGIGTTTPSKPLHIYSGVDDYQLLIERSTALDAAISFKNSEQQWTLGFMGGSDDFAIADTSSLDSNVRLLIKDGSGLVGIGTTTPAVGLHVYRTASSTIQIGDAVKTACLVMGDSDGAGISYITVLDGVLSATTTKPSICQ